MAMPLEELSKVDEASEAMSELPTFVNTSGLDTSFRAF